MIHRPQGRAAAVGKVRVEDGDEANGSAYSLTVNAKTQTRAPLPAYRSTKESLGNVVSASGKVRTFAATTVNQWR